MDNLGWYIIAGLLPIADGNMADPLPIADGKSKTRQNDQYSHDTKNHKQISRRYREGMRRTSAFFFI